LSPRHYLFSWAPYFHATIMALVDRSQILEQKSDSGRNSSYVHKSIKVDSSHMQGNGLFATGPIVEGEVVAWEYAEQYQGLHDNRPGKKIMTWAQIEERWPDQQERDIMVAYSYQIGEDAFLIPLRQDDLVITTYQNHSCDPNTWWVDDFTLVARRYIQPGEEVTFDYSTSESLENPEMPECHCGTPSCRKRLDPLDYLNPVLMDRYGNHFISYLLARQQKHIEAIKNVTVIEANDKPPSDSLDQTKQAKALADSYNCDSNGADAGIEICVSHDRK